MRRVVLLAGPSGSGKSRLARESGLPVINLDDFYRDGTDSDMPRRADLGIIDWDDPRAWNAERACDALVRLCRTGSADIPEYDIGLDRATGHRVVDVGDAAVVVAEGLFAGEIVDACRQHGILAHALVLRRQPWKNFARRIARDLAERRKPPWTVIRRGITLWRAETAVVRRQIGIGARPVTADEVRAALRDAADAPSGMP